MGKWTFPLIIFQSVELFDSRSERLKVRFGRVFLSKRVAYDEAWWSKIERKDDIEESCLLQQRKEYIIAWLEY